MSNTVTTDWEQLEAEELQRIARLERDESARRWAKYPRPNPFWQAYGFGSTLYKLKGDADNPMLSPLTRKQAHDGVAKIIRQIQDKKLMSLRQRLIRASIAQDERAIAHITQQMRDYTQEDRETGLYE